MFHDETLWVADGAKASISDRGDTTTGERRREGAGREEERRKRRSELEGSGDRCASSTVLTCTPYQVSAELVRQYFYRKFGQFDRYVFPEVQTHPARERERERERD